MDNDLMTPDEELDEFDGDYEPLDRRTDAFAYVTFAIRTVLMVVLAFAIGYLVHTPPAVDPTTNSITKQLEYQLKIAEYDHDWRSAVIEACVNKGGIPFVLNGNVDCKK